MLECGAREAVKVVLKHSDSYRARNGRKRAAVYSFVGGAVHRKAGSALLDGSSESSFLGLLDSLKSRWCVHMGGGVTTYAHRASTDCLLLYTVPFSECKFTCTSGKCLYLGSLVCNHQNDCGDNSDEENCPLVTEHPPPGIFNCKSLWLTLVALCLMVF